MTKVNKTIGRALVAAMILLPMQAVRADMIALDGALPGKSDRQEVIVRLEALGISSQAARERVAALTGEEAAALTKEIESLPAGGNALIAFAAIVLFLFFVFNQNLEKGK